MSDNLTLNYSYISMSLDALSSAQTSSRASELFNGTHPVSVDAWIRFNGLPSNTVAIGQDGVFAFGSQGPLVYFWFQNQPAILSDPKQTLLQDNHWHYICATFDGSTVRLYIDGQFNVGQSCMGSVTPGSNPVSIGTGLQGLVRRIRIYNTVISAEAVLNNMYGAPQSSTLFADFDFSVNPPVERGPSKFPINLQNAASMLSVSPAASLGTTGFIRPFGDGAVNPGGAQIDPYTVQAWIFISSPKNQRQTIFINSDLMLETGIALYLLCDSVSSDFKLISQRGSGNDPNQRLASIGKVPVGVWINVATTFDGKTLSLYINGVLDSSKECLPIPLRRQLSNLLIGASIESGVPTGASTLLGYIQEVDVWSKALNANEILACMRQSPDVSAPGIEAVYVFTNSPARNQVNGHPVGLAENAVLSGQLGPAPLSEKDAPAEDAALPEMGLVPELMESIRAGLNFSMVAQNNCEAFDKAMAADMDAFSDPKDKELIKAAWLDARRKIVEEPTSLPFLTTIHTIDNERLIIVHRPMGSYVVYRAAASDIDECTLWKILLFFTVIAGALFVITGFKVGLTDKVINYIRQFILKKTKIAMLLALGESMTASTIFSLLKETSASGNLRPLLMLLLVDVGVWTLFSIVGKMIATATGFGAAQVIASFAVAATAFIVEYKSKPAACNPLPSIGLASITFDYDPTGLAIDSLTIRKNYNTAVNIPEWTMGKVYAADSPCAYAISAISGHTPTIQAAFTISSPTTKVVSIRATGGGILGAIDPFVAVFGTDNTVSMILNLNHHQLTGGGVQRQDASWVWQYQIDGGAWTTITTSNHRVYVLFSSPKRPWKQDPDRLEQQLPWTDVLDHVCQWAAGAIDENTVLSMITAQINNNNSGLTYDIGRGASVYTTPYGDFFMCTQFVDYLINNQGNGHVVNCTDCAAIVTSFANILGCDIFASVMSDNMPPNNGFKCNEIMAIGYNTWQRPFPSGGSGGFRYHEVVWQRAGSYENPIHDACLQFDGGPNPWGTTGHTARLPINIPFTTRTVPPSLPVGTPFTDNSYCERLCTNDNNGIGQCKPVGPWLTSSSGRRPAI